MQSSGYWMNGIIEKLRGDKLIEGARNRCHYIP